MENDALKKLRGHSIVNALNKRYPDTRYISMNTTELHIEIYKLVAEYVGLYKDNETATTPSVKGYISKRMNEIERTLTNYWIVPDDKMITPDN